LIRRFFQSVRRQCPQIFIWVFAAAALTYRLGAEPLTETEMVYARTIRALFTRGDFAGLLQVSGTETPLWFLLGGVISQSVGSADAVALLTRIPSVAGALLVLGIVLVLAKRLYGVSAALTAGWMLAGSCVFLLPGRMGLPLMTASASNMVMVGFFFLAAERQSVRTLYLFWILFFAGGWSAGLSTQCAVLPFLLPFFSFSGFRRRVRNWQIVPAFLIGAVFYMLPMIIAERPSGVSGWLSLCARELARDFAESTPLRTPSADLWFYGCLPFFALEITAVWGALLQWRKLGRLTRMWGIGLLLTAGYWCVLPEEGAAPALLLPCGVIFFAAVLHRAVLGSSRNRVLLWNRILVEVGAAGLVFSLIFCAFGEMLFHLQLLKPPALVLSGCGLAGVLLMRLDEWRPLWLERLSGIPRDLASQVLCLAWLSASILCGVMSLFGR